VGFFRRGLMTATLKECGMWPVNKDTLIISNRELPIKGKTSLSSLVGKGSKRQVDVLEVETVDDNWSRLMGEKPSEGLRHIPGHTAVSKAIPLEDRLALVKGKRLLILPLIVKIFSLKKFTKSLPLRSIGILGSTNGMIKYIIKNRLTKLGEPKNCIERDNIT